MSIGSKLVADMTKVEGLFKWIRKAGACYIWPQLKFAYKKKVKEGARVENIWLLNCISVVYEML